MLQYFVLLEIDMPTTLLNLHTSFSSGPHKQIYGIQLSTRELQTSILRTDTISAYIIQYRQTVVSY